MAQAGDLQRLWRSAVHTYAQRVNAYVAAGERTAWADAGPAPRFAMIDGAADAVLDAVREANRRGQLEGLRDRWPPAYEPLAELIKDNGQGIATLAILDDGSILARIGAPWVPGRVVRIAGDDVEDIPDVQHFGRCPGRRYFAMATADGVRVTDGWGGAQVGLLPWPTGREEMPAGVTAAAFASPPTTLVPLPDGTRVVLTCQEGVFVLTPSGARRLLPTADTIQDHLTSHDGPVSCRVDMEHAAVSADGTLIAAGTQDGVHVVFDDDLAAVARIGPHSEYPHFAVFSDDQTMVAFNSCHLYNGTTIGVPTRLLPGLVTEPYDDERITTLDDHARVYAGASRGDELILGDANGYVHAVGTDGAPRWRHFVGATVSAMDISADGRTLAVATHAGWIAIIALDAGDPQPYQIGTGGHRELRRWLFWKNEPAPLAW